MPSENQSNRARGELCRRAFLGQLGAGAAGAAACAGIAEAKAPGAPHSPSGVKIVPDQQELDEVQVRNRAIQAIGRKAKAKGLNLVVVIADTFRLDHVGAYGPTRAKTPCLDEFARQGVVFENAFAEGLPTIPCRRVYHTGKSVLPGAAWIPHPAGQVNLAQILGAHGFWTGLVCDVYHYFAPNMNLHAGFNTWEWIRGQEGDAYLGGPRDQFQPKHHMPPELWNPDYDRFLRTYMMNTQHFQTEDDYFAAQTVRASTQWLKQNTTNKPFMLWVEIFDPHEPWDAPPRFQKMYRDDYGFKRFLFGYGFRPEPSKTGKGPNFLPHLPLLCDLYAAEVSYVDHCIGRLLESMEKMKLLDDTIVVFTTDHGTHLGEQGYLQKQGALLNSLVMHVPLMVRHPERSTAGKRVSELVSAIDVAPTLAGMLGIDDQEQMDGRNAWDLVTAKSAGLHEQVFTQFGNFASVRSRKWHYFQHVAGTFRGAGPCLFDLEADPGEKTNVVAKHPERAAELRTRIADRLHQKLPEIPSGIG